MDLDGPWPTVELVPLADYPADGTPATRLNEARAAQAVQEWGRRSAGLDAAAADPALADEVEAERAIDDAVANRRDAAEHRARALLDGTTNAVAGPRAREALGRALLWQGLAGGAVDGAALMQQAIAGYRALGSTEWAGGALFWLGNAAHLQRGELDAARRLFNEALTELAPTSPRRPTVLTFLADVHNHLGDWTRFDAVLDEADHLIPTSDRSNRAYLAWSRAKGACTRGDRVGTVRWINEVEHNIGDWFTITSGATFLGEAAAMLERVGDSNSARDYLRRAAERDATDEFVRMAEAELLARSGDPHEALSALRAISHATWLEVVQQWRMTLLTAWSYLRGGLLEDAASTAARGFAEADAIGGPVVAGVGEPRIARLLAPLAARAGSPQAAQFLSSSGLMLRLLGRSELTRSGASIPIPRGLPGELLRLVATNDHGIDAERVIDLLWPEADVATGRRLLRTTLSRLRTRIGDVVERDGNQLVLADLWLDLHAFRTAADQALSERQADVVLAALALWTGTPLPGDLFADWARDVRNQLVRRRLRLLDLAADLMPDRAELFLEDAIETDPSDTSRYEWLARLLDERGRVASARRWRTRAAQLANE